MSEYLTIEPVAARPRRGAEARAALARQHIAEAMSLASPELAAICRDLEIEIVGESDRYGPRQTRARATMEDILRRHGAGHLIFCLRVFLETRIENERAMCAAALYAVSDLMVAHPEWPEKGEAFLAAFDRVDLEGLTWAATKCRHIVPRRFALIALLFERVCPILGV